MKASVNDRAKQEISVEDRLAQPVTDVSVRFVFHPVLKNLRAR